MVEFSVSLNFGNNLLNLNVETDESRTRYRLSANEAIKLGEELIKHGKELLKNENCPVCIDCEKPMRINSNLTWEHVYAIDAKNCRGED